MDAFDENHAVQPFHERNGKAEVFIEQQIDRPVLPEQQHHGHSPHERRHDEGNDAQRLDQDRTAEIEAGREIGQRQGEHRRQDHGHGRHVKGIEKGFLKQRGIEKIDKVNKRQGTRVGVLERHIDDLGNRNDKEHDQEQGQGQGNGAGTPKAARYGGQDIPPVGIRKVSVGINRRPVRPWAGRLNKGSAYSMEAALSASSLAFA